MPYILILLFILLCINIPFVQLYDILIQNGQADKVTDNNLFDNESFMHESKGKFQHKRHLENIKLSQEVKNVSKDNVSVLFDSVCLEYEHTINCSHLNLKAINSSWFPNSTEILFLNDNLLTVLFNSTFSLLAHLTYLNISNNRISNIETLAFEGLSSLKYLDISYNEILIFGISGNILKPLTNLKYLDLIQDVSTQTTDVPGSILQTLTKLTNLSISTVNYTLYFGPEFLNLTNLEVLRITGSTRNISDSSFENVSQLKELVLRDMMFINFVHNEVFVHFKKLARLEMTNVIIDIQQALALLWPFTRTYMSEIYFDTVTSTPQIPIPIKNGVLTRKDLMYLTQICLAKFSLINCRVYYITIDAFINRTVWNHCLRDIVISRNSLIGSSMALFQIAFLQNLSNVEVNKVIRPCQWVSQRPRLSVNDNYAYVYCSVKDLSFHEKIIKENDETFEINQTVANTFYVYMSTHLTSWNSRQLVSYFELIWNVTLRGAENFEYLDLSDNGFRRFIGHFQGVLSLKTIILSENEVSVLAEYFFDGFFGLQKLELSNCKLDKNFFAIKSDRVFHNTTILKELDLSYNSLYDLSRNTFSRNTEIKYLILSGNQFKEIPFNLEFTPNLKYLDISNNIIITLTVKATRILDFQSLINKGFQLMLDGNILSCGCHDLSFLQWLNSTLVSLDNNRNYTCMNKDGERTNTLAFPDLESLWRQCWGEFYFYIALSTLFLYVIGVVLFFLMSRNKNFLVSYFFQFFGNFKFHTRSDYTTDVYIGYSDVDYRFPCIELREHLERNLQLSTFVIERDLLASLDKASGIVEAINSCWRVLLVCNESFLNDEDWSLFTMKSAMYAQTPANRARIVVIVHTGCFSLLPTELLSVVNDENIIVVSEWRINYTLSEKLRTRLMT